MKRCFWLTGLTHADLFSVNAGFIIGDKETVIIDTGFNLEAARTIYDFAYQVAPDNRISMVVNLEGHYDHIFGNAYFIENGCKIIAFKDVCLTEKELKDYKREANQSISISRRRENQEGELYFEGVKPFIPDIKISENTRLSIQGVDIEIYLAAGHTESNLILYEKNEKVMYVADTIYSGFLPTFSFGNINLWGNWISVLDFIEKQQPQVVVPGHGKILFGEAIIGEINRHRSLLFSKIKEERMEEGNEEKGNQSSIYK